MTTVSSTSGTTYTPTTTNTTSTATTSTASTSTAYDGSAAVAQAQALAAQEVSNGASGSSGNLLGLSSDLLNLLQGSGGGLASTLLGGSGGNSFYAAQAQTALYGAAQARYQSSASTDRVSDLIAANNAAANQANTATSSDTSATDGTTDTTA